MQPLAQRGVPLVERHESRRPGTRLIGKVFEYSLRLCALEAFARPPNTFHYRSTHCAVGSTNSSTSLA